jgi:hypothetical protein
MRIKGPEIWSGALSHASAARDASASRGNSKAESGKEPLLIPIFAFCEHETLGLPIRLPMRAETNPLPLYTCDDQVGQALSGR